MNEKTENKETTPENADANTGEGIQQGATSDLDRADEIVERRNRVCEREEQILSRKEAFAARQAVGGIANAGQETTPQFSDKEKESRARIKAVADVTGASWGKNYE